MTLERAIALAVEAHRGQRDKAGAPYILHPLRLMMAMTSDAARIVAVLHDVVEDSDVTFEALVAEGLAPRCVQALRALTKLPGEAYEAFIERVAVDALATEVKRADLRDNLDVARCTDPAQIGPERLARYVLALRRLGPA